jgi:cell division inhibitor SepF
MATMWKRALAYLGLVEEEYDDEYANLPEEGTMPSEGTGVMPPPRPEPSNVRRIAPARTAEPRGTSSATVRPVPSATVHVTNPTTFNDVEEVGEHFRTGVPVIMNLAGASEGVAKRMLDFASGLIYGLHGRIERVGDRVFLLTPEGVEVSTEERRKLSERGFFNQA